MPGGPGSFTRSSTSSVLLWYASQRGPSDLAYGTITRSGQTFQNTSANDGFVTPQGARNPDPKVGLGYVRVRSPLLTESMSLSSPAGTEMFQFPAFAPRRLCVRRAVTGR